MRVVRWLLVSCALGAVFGAAASGAAADGSGGTGFVPGPGPVSAPLHPVVPGLKARVIHGLAYAPAEAPPQIQAAIWAGDEIRRMPYGWGGGHGAWISSGYDCSGSVSYVLHAAGLLPSSMDSSQFEAWGESGRGQWITVYANPGHAFIQIAGIRLDTSAEGDPHPPPGSGPRWRSVMRSTRGYVARHPLGF